MKILSKHPNLAVIFASFFWGTYWIPLRSINQDGEESVWPLALSFLLVSIILFKPLIISLKKQIYNNDLYFILGNISSALAIALYSESLLRGEIAKVVLLFYLCPIWGTILAKIVLHQSFNIQRYLSLILGIIGLEIILKIDKGIFLPTTLVEWMALSAGFTWALGMTFFHLSKTTKEIEKASCTSLLIPIFFLILALIPGGRETEIVNIDFSSNIFLLWIVLFAIIWVLPSIFLTYVSVEILDPGRINILLMFEVIIGITTAAILTDEVIGLREIIGAIFIISAGVIELIKIKT